MSETIGLDYASVDKNNTPNFAAAARAGARFAIVRAVYGRGGANSGAWWDPTWSRDSERIAAAGLRRGAYLFLCLPQTSAGTVTPNPEDQVDAFASYVQLTSYHDLVPFIDVEEQSMLAPADYYAWVVRAVERMKEHYGAWPGIYTSARVWNEYMGGHDAGDLLNCPPWIAKPWPLDERQPIDLTGAPAYHPDVPPQLGTNNWWLYQYQGDALGWPGFTSTVDASRFNVTTSGAAGAHVAWLQQRLGVAVDGAFGPDTRAAVIALQQRYGLEQDGVVGPDTFAAACWHA